MKINEHDFYSERANWSFEDIDYTSEVITNWIYEDEIKKRVKENTKILDLGTAAGEKVLKKFPNCAEILGTDFSDKMIETANKNLLQSGRRNISFRVMDNLKMDTPDNYFDLVTARHTIIDPLQIYKTLKEGGQLIVRGVDKLDCWQLKRLFGNSNITRITLSRNEYSKNIIKMTLFGQLNILAFVINVYKPCSFWYLC